MTNENAKKINTTTKIKSSITLPPKIFKVKVNKQVIFDSIMSERSSIRQGTHKVKTRAEVSGTGKKPFSQKGTGNARQGSKRSPQWVGGGVSWGPNKNKNYKLKVNKKVKKLAFKSALTLKANDKAIMIHDFVISEVPNTKKIIEQIDVLKIKSKFKKILIITNNNIILKSTSNLQKINAIKLSNLKVESIIGSDFMIFSEDSIKSLRGNK